MGDINYGAWPHWLEYGCLIKMRDDLTEQDTVETYGVYLPREMMDELFGEVFELISAEEYLEREKRIRNCATTPHMFRGTTGTTGQRCASLQRPIQSGGLHHV